jgi:hypothetical protein
MLAETVEPLVLADGRMIDPATGKVMKPANKTKMVEVPKHSEAQALVVRARRSVADLPAPPEKLTSVGLVAFYTLFGLDDVSISIALENRLTVEQIKRIRDLEVYQQFMADARESLITAERDNVQAILVEHAKNAAEKVVELASSDNDVLAFKASQDILDRTGNRPVDIVEHRHRMVDALQVVFIKRDANESIPTIDVEATHVDCQ